MSRRYAILLAAVALAGVMNSPAQARRFAVVRTTASAAIEQPATIASSQDLMFVVSTSSLSLSLSSTTTTSTTTTASRLNSSPTLRTASLPAAGRATQIVPAPARASFVLAGDAGQSISVTMPGTVDLTRAGGVETARLITDSSITDGPQFLGGSFASAGVLSFDVGGQVTMANTSAASGTYNGVLAVVAQYN